MVETPRLVLLEPLDGKATIAQAWNTFTNIDDDFNAWGLNNEGMATKKTSIEIRNLYGNILRTLKIYKLSLDDLDNLCLTQSQIIEFCEKYPEELGQEDMTLFLFKENNTYFVAYVDMVSGKLDIHVLSLYHKIIRASWWHHLVLQQLKESDQKEKK